MTMFKIGIGRRIEVEKIIPRLKFTGTKLIKGVNCRECGGRLRIEGVYTCRACMYHGHRRIKADCIRCHSKCELWLLADGRLVAQ